MAAGPESICRLLDDFLAVHASGTEIGGNGSELHVGKMGVMTSRANGEMMEAGGIIVSRDSAVSWGKQRKVGFYETVVVNSRVSTAMGVVMRTV